MAPVLLAALTIGSLLAGCGDGGGDDVAALPTASQAVASHCNGLKGLTVASAQIGVGVTSLAGMATSGAVVDDAQVVAATSSAGAYCKVTGRIKPSDPTSSDINFQVNLPANWNGKALQYGGYGLNGQLITGLDSLPDAPAGSATPLQRGYVTLGSDSGHGGGPTVATFGLNDESLLNYAYASIKKTRDVAAVIARSLYQRDIGRTYFAGASGGGRESLTAAERFGSDYAGIVAVVPAIQFTAFGVNSNRIAQSMSQPGGAFDLATVTLLHQTTLAKCDGLDNLLDGIISRPFACTLTDAEVEALTCSQRASPCLSDAQVNTLRAIHQAAPLGFTTASGNGAYFPLTWGAELSVSSTFPTGGMDVWMSTPFSFSPLLGAVSVKFLFMQDASLNTATFDPAANQAKLQSASARFDADDAAALGKFLKGGGKVIIREAGGDFARSPYSTIDFVQRVETVDAAAVASGLRLYVNPMVDHFGVGVQPNEVDLLTYLDDWVERAQVPADTLTVSRTQGGTTQTRLMCRYPDHPRYNGSGDVNSAASFTCVSGP